MLVTAMILFLIGAIFGLAILKTVLKHTPRSPLLRLMHGIFVFIGLLLVITYVASGNTSTLILTSMILFIAAALGGFTMLTMDVTKKPIPKALALGHPLLAVTALVLLIVYLLQ